MLHLATQSGEEKYGGLHQLPLQTLPCGRQTTEHHLDGFLGGVTFKSFLLITKEIFYVLRFDNKNFMNVLLQYYLHIFLHWPSQLQEEARKGGKDLV